MLPCLNLRTETIQTIIRRTAVWWRKERINSCAEGQTVRQRDYPGLRKEHRGRGVLRLPIPRKRCHTMFGGEHRGMFFRELYFPKERDGTAFCEEHRKRNVSGLRFSENRHRSEIAREYHKGCVRSERCGEEGVTKLYCKIHIDFIFDEFLYQ